MHTSVEHVRDTFEASNALINLMSACANAVLSFSDLNLPKMSNKWQTNKNKLRNLPRGNVCLGMVSQMLCTSLLNKR